MTMPKFATQDADAILTRLDKLAGHIQQNHEAWGMPFDTAKGIVNELDKVADAVEESTFGKESMMRRQAEVLQRDSDEKYMDTFKNPMEPLQREADEPYMSAYGMPDQSSVVLHGQDSTGRKLAPGHGPHNSGT
jgi:hypothetical protein